MPKRNKNSKRHPPKARSLEVQESPERHDDVQAEERCRELALAASLLLSQHRGPSLFRVWLERVKLRVSRLMQLVSKGQWRLACQPTMAFAAPRPRSFSPPAERRVPQLAAAATACGLFDPDWYLARYPDAALAGVDPLEHYLAMGLWLDRPPGPNFDVAGYRWQHRLDDPWQPAFLHYLKSAGATRSNGSAQPDAPPPALGPDHHLFGYVDVPRKRDLIGHDYIRVRGWCYLYGMEIESVRAQLSNSRQSTPLRHGIYRPDVAAFRPNLRFFTVGFQGDVYPSLKGGGTLKLIVSARTTTGFVHTIKRELLPDPTAGSPPENKYAADSQLAQALNGHPIH